jgi:DKNYY family
MTYSFYRPSFAETLELHRPSDDYREGDPRRQYWKKLGLIYFHDFIVPHSDSATFVFYLSGLASDQNGCFFNALRKPKLHSKSLKSFSFAYFGDEHRICTSTAEIKGADLLSFRALDRGFRTIQGGKAPLILIPCGYAKDKNRAYFCDGGNAMPIAKADPSSFESLAGEFGADDRQVFHGRASLPKAHRQNWRLLGGAFSTDGVRVYSRNHIVDGADPDSFSVFSDPLDMYCYASDKHSFYGGSNRISKEEFESRTGDASQVSRAK